MRSHPTVAPTRRFTDSMFPYVSAGGLQVIAEDGFDPTDEDFFSGTFSDDGDTYEDGKWIGNLEDDGGFDAHAYA